MRLTVEYYGLLRPLMGVPSQALDFSGTTVADALETLCAQAPQLRGHLTRVACALDNELVTPEQPIGGHTVLALIPPVSGGAR